MVLFQTTILGSSAAMPTSERHTSSQLVRHHNKLFLIDCAEGCQMQLRRFKQPFSKIDHIFISHLHGDHYLGLPGLLFTYHLLGRQNDLHIYAPAGLEEIIRIQIETADLIPSYKLVFHEIIEGGQPLYEDKWLTAETMAMEHRIPTFGFILKEKPGHPHEGKAGPRSYGIGSDTAYTESFLSQIRGVDLLYHEATFMHDDAVLAREKYHSTTVEAALLAKKALAGRLLLGHYSARYKETDAYLDEARQFFTDTLLALEGETIAVRDHAPKKTKA